MGITEYDPFAAGHHDVAVRTIEANDAARDRRFPVEIWCPAVAEAKPLIVFSHYSGGHRRTATYLATHLASHGYVVAAMDHSEVGAPELTRSTGATAAERAGRVDDIIASRVPDVRFLLDHLLGGAVDVELDAARIGLVGHSFGWVDGAGAARSRCARGSGGGASAGRKLKPEARNPSGQAHIRVGTRRADALPCSGERRANTTYRRLRVFDRTPSSKRMFILRRADHQHFIDNVEDAHEAVRAATFPPEAAWIPAAMRPIAELSSGEQAHTFVRGLTLAHFDATLREMNTAERFLSGDIEGALASRAVEAFVHRDVATN